jgi:hypothetical protein
MRDPFTTRSERQQQFTAREIARALGGEVIGRDRVAAPGPNHSKRDRSLSILITSDGFVVHSFSGDDWRVCRDHVRAALGLPTFGSGSRL